MSFGPPSTNFREDHNAACKVSATYIASSWPDAVPGAVLTAGKRIYKLCGSDHESLLCPQGYVTGRLPVESWLVAQMEDLFQAGWAVTWRASYGCASSCDTFLITETGPHDLTPGENWPLKKIYVQGANFLRPDLLVR
jgi:hypothetical protein